MPETTAKELTVVVIELLKRKGFFCVDAYSKELEKLIQKELQNISLRNAWNQQEPGIDY